MEAWVCCARRALFCFTIGPLVGPRVLAYAFFVFVVSLSFVRAVREGGERVRKRVPKAGARARRHGASFRNGMCRNGEWCSGCCGLLMVHCGLPRVLSSPPLFCLPALFQAELASDIGECHLDEAQSRQREGRGRYVSSLFLCVVISSYVR